MCWRAPVLRSRLQSLPTGKFERTGFHCSESRMVALKLRSWPTTALASVRAQPNLPLSTQSGNQQFAMRSVNIAPSSRHLAAGLPDRCFCLSQTHSLKVSRGNALLLGRAVPDPRPHSLTPPPVGAPLQSQSRCVPDLEEESKSKDQRQPTGKGGFNNGAEWGPRWHLLRDCIREQLPNCPVRNRACFSPLSVSRATRAPLHKAALLTCGVHPSTRA